MFHPLSGGAAPPLAVGGSGRAHRHPEPTPPAITATPWAPWHVLPADDKSVLQVLAATVLVDTITSLGPDRPKVTANDRETNARARRALLEEE